MIHSMTGFAREQAQADWGYIVWEIRSINHRFLDVNVRLPELFRYMEGDIRQLVKTKLSRGKIDLTLSYQAGTATVADIIVEDALVNQLAVAYKKVQSLIPDIQAINAIDILNWPGVTKIKEADVSALASEANHTLANALDALLQMRQSEGEELSQGVFERIVLAQHHINELYKKTVDISQKLQQKLHEKIENLAIKVDSQRLEQEVVFYLQRIDVAEELDRLQAHLREVEATLKKGGPAGRRLDFLMQECNREANTLGAKSVDANFTKTVVELKVLIEQMREQVQNIE